MDIHLMQTLNVPTNLRPQSKNKVKNLTVERQQTLGDQNYI